ncbi:MAG: hypothetical protein JNL38_01055 [Myxococcales bacterium]|nr:hypothetical protein [Myxococcales bacterium]
MTSRSWDIDVVEGLEAIRRRPTMYIAEEAPDHTLCSRLVERALLSFSAGPPAPTAVRLLLWRDGGLTLAYDGEPLPIRGHDARSGVVHPELYSWFLTLTAPITPVRLGAVVVNALSERLVISTLHGGVRYRAAFQKGGLVSLLSTARLAEAFGASWLTFQPDGAIVPGRVDASAAERIAARVARESEGGAVSVIDRSTEKPDWW